MDSLTILKTGDIALQGEFLWGSNYTLLVDVSCADGTLKAVYKPSRGVRPLWDFDSLSLAHREVLAFLLSEELGWRLVPPTVFRRSGPMGPGSLQLFVEHDPEVHFFSFSPETRRSLQPAAAFDVLINNADRKGGHFIVDPEEHIWLIDHGICFHEEPKLRTVLWDFAGEPIDENILSDLENLRRRLAVENSTAALIRRHLSEREAQALLRRLDRLISRGVFPLPPQDARPYPWPLV